MNVFWIIYNILAAWYDLNWLFTFFIFCYSFFKLTKIAVHHLNSSWINREMINNDNHSIEFYAIICQQTLVRNFMTKTRADKCIHWKMSNGAMRIIKWSNSFHLLYLFLCYVILLHLLMLLAATNVIVVAVELVFLSFGMCSVHLWRKLPHKKYTHKELATT